jgi:hypothetical protein
VLSGEALLIVEGEERPLRQWDLFHCAAGTKHIIVGAGDAPCAVLAVGAREHQGAAGWGGYPVDETALPPRRRSRRGSDRSSAGICPVFEARARAVSGGLARRLAARTQSLLADQRRGRGVLACRSLLLGH